MENNIILTLMYLFNAEYKGVLLLQQYEFCFALTNEMFKKLPKY